MSAFLKVMLTAPLLAGLLLFINASARSSAPASHDADQWWPTYGGTYANTRHVDLKQITAGNVASLKLAWKFNTGVLGQFESTPIAVDGVVYISTATNSVYALDAQTGSLKWSYAPKVGPAPSIFTVNRGVAVAGNRVFLTTLDAHIIALDAANGQPLWNRAIGESRDGLSETAAPLAWNGLVYVGSSGNEFGVRGSYTAYDQKDGRLVWRWYSVSPGWEGTFANDAHGLPLHRNIARERAEFQRRSDAWQHGGGAIWMTPALSPQDGVIYLSTGNPAPAFRGDKRPGDNLYTDCIVALDAHSGKMKWYYQETPHDVWDFDASSPPALFDATDASGHRIPAVGEAGKTGLLYILNRKTGSLLRVSDTFTGQPLRYDPPSETGAKLDFGGALSPLAYDEAEHTAFVDAVVQPQVIRTFPAPLKAWSPGTIEWTGGASEDTQLGADALTSIDVDTGRKRWSTPISSVDFSGMLSTPGLIFLGEQYTGDFRAYDTVNGKVLWQVRPADAMRSPFDIPSQLMYTVGSRAVHVWHRVRHIAETGFGNGAINAPPIAYRYKGREYILIGSNVYHQFTHDGGETLFAFALK